MKTLSIIAIAGLAVAANAQTLQATNNPGHSASNMGSAATGTYTLNFDEFHFGLVGDPANTVISLDLNALLGGQAGADAFVTGLGWDVTIEAFDPSWLSEAGYGFPDDVTLNPSADGNPGTGSFSSGGLVDISDAVGFDILASGGILNIEFFDNFDDASVSPDARSFGTLDIQVAYTVPAPAGLAVLGLGGLVATRRRR